MTDIEVTYFTFLFPALPGFTFCLALPQFPTAPVLKKHFRIDQLGNRVNYSIAVFNRLFVGTDLRKDWGAPGGSDDTPGKDLCQGWES